MNLQLLGKRALVGGATSGLGLATAQALAEEGCTLVLWSRDQARLDEVADGIRGATGTQVSTVVGDSADPDTAHIVATEAGRDGPIDIVILNGGGPPPVDPTATTGAGWESAMHTLAITPILLATELLPGMRSRGFGRIVAILSSGVAEPIPALAYSNAGRSALAAWLKTVSGAVAADGVTVNGVMPGRIDTPRVAALDLGRATSTGRPVEEIRTDSENSIPLGRYGTPAEFASFLVMLCSPVSGYVTGRLHAVDGGMIRSA
ncbi:MAG: 3-oxoacyl-[acyl-carrier protein] reductase [Pseudonocardiales bacterium]|nr:3-oxoacyl-[acyl-carrier protein] reductase [Pseudonocardiales bacterium]